MRMSYPSLRRDQLHRRLSSGVGRQRKGEWGDKGKDSMGEDMGKVCKEVEWGEVLVAHAGDKGEVGIR